MTRRRAPYVFKNPNPPFFRLESRGRVPGDEEEGSHGMHVAQSCGRQRGNHLSFFSDRNGPAFISVFIAVWTHAELLLPSL